MFSLWKIVFFFFVRCVIVIEREEEEESTGGGGLSSGEDLRLFWVFHFSRWVLLGLLNVLLLVMELLAKLVCWFLTPAILSPRFVILPLFLFFLFEFQISFLGIWVVFKFLAFSIEFFYFCLFVLFLNSCFWDFELKYFIFGCLSCV